VRRHPAPVLLALTFAFVLPGASGDTRPSAPGERVRADVARLAADEWQGRRAGTPGAGLLPGGDAGAYFQTFSFIDGVVLGARNRLGLGDRVFKPGEE